MAAHPEDGPGTHVVEACSWDLTMGAATHVFGKLFLRSTSSSSHETPDAIDHVGIIAFSRLYEYGHNGIRKSNMPRNGEDPNPQYPGCKLRKREYLGKSRRSKEEFFEWIVNVKYGEFKGSNYDMIHHNCLDFARAVCSFLRVPPNPNWEKICNWAKNNRKIAGFFTRSGACVAITGNGNSPGSESGSESPSSSSSESSRRNRLLRHTGRSMTIPEESTTDCNGDEGNEANENSAAPAYATAVVSSPRRRRFSMNPPISLSGRSHSRFSFRSRSSSMETLPPTYEEALQMSIPRRDSIQSAMSAAPSYETYMKMREK